jgi:hypothetical protein
MLFLVVINHNPYAIIIEKEMEMKIQIKKDVHSIHSLLKNYFDDYNIINDSRFNETTYFFVAEKFFWRNSSRASISIVMTEIDEYTRDTYLEAVGSGGGQGLIFKFDWVAKESFEKKIIKILEKENISYQYKVS